MDFNPDIDYNADIATYRTLFKGYKPWYRKWFKRR